MGGAQANGDGGGARVVETAAGERRKELADRIARYQTDYRYKPASAARGVLSVLVFLCLRRFRFQFVLVFILSDISPPGEARHCRSLSFVVVSACYRF